MPEIEIKIQKADGSIESLITQCSMIGNLAVHLNYHEEDDCWDVGDYAITSPVHGMKFPGTVYGLKAAEACARELNELCDWRYFDKESQKDIATKAKDILNDWGFR